LSEWLAHPTVQCPYCWETFTVEVDLSIDSQSYIEDCQVCCQPIVISYEAPGGELMSINTEQDNA